MGRKKLLAGEPLQFKVCLLKSVNTGKMVRTRSVPEVKRSTQNNENLFLVSDFIRFAPNN